MILFPSLRSLKAGQTNPYVWTQRELSLGTSLLCNEIIAKEHEIIEFVPRENLITKSQIGIKGGYINEVFKNGDLVTIDFDGAVVQIIDHKNYSFYGRILHSGIIGNNKGLNIDRM